MQPVPHLSPQIDLMVLYDELSWSPDGFNYTEPFLLSRMAMEFERTNDALAASEIDLRIELVHVGRVSAGAEQTGPHGTWCWYFCLA